MARYKLTIAYDGTDFHGWQRQFVPAELAEARSGVGAVAPAGSRVYPRMSEDGRVELRTVQGVLQQAVCEVVREPVEVTGASRTDAGVHARGQVAAFTCSGEGREGRGWPVERGVETLVRAVNSRLAADALVTGAEVVGAGFDPISDCTSKGYSYTLHVGMHRPLWDRRFVTHCWVDLDVGAMQEAAARIVGRHDFASFAAAGHGRQSTVRTVFDCRVSEGEGGRIRIDVSGDGFLYNMVRIIAGTLVEVGRGKIASSEIGEIIASGDRRRAGPTLAPMGLCLEWVAYG